jgi:ornithine cyclodeaminase
MANDPVAILTLPTIQEYLKTVDLIPLIEKGFIAYSLGEAVVPPVGELLFENPPGETHIKYGYIKQQPYYVVKIASGFYENAKLGLKSSQGLMLLFSQQTGELLCVLLDEGYLTDIRTVIASMITIKYLAPAKVDCLGIIGTGTQAKLQVEYLSQVCECKKIMIWGRHQESAIAFQKYFQNIEYNIQIASSADALAQACNLIITTTPSREPLLNASQIRKGTHITALGSDTTDKIELDPIIIKNADIVVSDSIPQSQSRGEIFQARNHQCLDSTKLVELGTLIQNLKLGRKNDQQITVADLTGVAVQDIMIAAAIYNHHKSLQNEH